MKKIVLNVEDENVNIILNILENLKDGLIQSIETDSKKLQNVRYTPKSKDVVREGSMPSGKYLSKDEYKRRVKKN